MLRTTYSEFTFVIISSGFVPLRHVPPSPDSIATVVNNVQNSVMFHFLKTPEDRCYILEAKFFSRKFTKYRLAARTRWGAQTPRHNRGPTSNGRRREGMGRRGMVNGGEWEGEEGKGGEK